MHDNASYVTVLPGGKVAAVVDARCLAGPRPRSSGSGGAGPELRAHALDDELMVQGVWSSKQYAALLEQAVTQREEMEC